MEAGRKIQKHYFAPSFMSLCGWFGLLYILYKDVKRNWVFNQAGTDGAKQPSDNHQQSNKQSHTCKYEEPKREMCSEENSWSRAFLTAAAAVFDKRVSFSCSPPTNGGETLTMTSYFLPDRNMCSVLKCESAPRGGFMTPQGSDEAKCT